MYSEISFEACQDLIVCEAVWLSEFEFHVEKSENTVSSKEEENWVWVVMW